MRSGSLSAVGCPASRKKHSIPAGVKSTIRRPSPPRRCRRSGPHPEECGWSRRRGAGCVPPPAPSRTRLRRCGSSRPHWRADEQAETSPRAGGRRAGRMRRRCPRRPGGSRCERRPASTRREVRLPWSDDTRARASRYGPVGVAGMAPPDGLSVASTQCRANPRQDPTRKRRALRSAPADAARQAGLAVAPAPDGRGMPEHANPGPPPHRLRGSGGS